MHRSQKSAITAKRIAAIIEFLTFEALPRPLRGAQTALHAPAHPQDRPPEGDRQLPRVPDSHQGRRGAGPERRAGQARSLDRGHDLAEPGGAEQAAAVLGGVGAGVPGGQDVEELVRQRGARGGRDPGRVPKVPGHVPATAADPLLVPGQGHGPDEEVHC